ncbi:hypothetical protein JOF41_007348 [Saccharothrix coeruleofusca]|nr:hypothetical protein [Saccharothrix coeruleofusca]MBP2341094.1 hypothetical protein [Saccharothrix coeruleofusca]
MPRKPAPKRRRRPRLIPGAKGNGYCINGCGQQTSGGNARCGPNCPGSGH